MSDSFATPLTTARQSPLSMGFPRKYWSGLPFPFLGDHPNPGIEPRSPGLQADSLLYEPPENPDPGGHGCKNPQKNISKPN